MGRGKNALKNLYIHKALSLIDAELELLNLKITHPNSLIHLFLQSSNQTYMYSQSLKNWGL